MKNILPIIIASLFIAYLLFLTLFLKSGTLVEYEKKECDYYDTQEFQVDGITYVSDICVNYEQ